MRRPRLSSITDIGTQSQTDPGLQLAPQGEAGPDFGALKKGYEDCITDNQPFIDQCFLNYQTRYALWPGQSADGKKHARDGKNGDVTPWDGASDLRVYLVDEAINAKVAMKGMAFRKANLVAVPVEGNDIKRAKVVENFMRWLIQTQIPEIDREVELLANYIEEKGAAVTGQFWEVCEEKTLQTIRLADFQRQFPQLDVQVMINTEGLEDDICALFEEQYGCSKKKARKMLAELREKGETTVPMVGRRKSYPVIRAFNLDEDLFIPTSATDIERAPAIYRVQYFTPEQLRAFVRSDGWDEEWVESAIEKCRGQLLTHNGTDPYSQPVSRSFIYVQQRFTDLIGVVYAYQRLSDEDGVSGIYLTIFNPFLPPDENQKGYAKFGLLPYAHGQYPFVLHRREMLSRRLHDTRGLPEAGKPWQDQIKAHKDSRIDAASLAVVPPIGYPVGRPLSKWGPGARIPERRQGEYHFMDRPLPDMNTDSSEAQLREDFKQYAGFASKEADPTFSALKNQWETDKFLAGLCKAFKQVWSLYKQFGPDEQYFRVIGLKNDDPALMQKGDPYEDYDIIMAYDVQSMDWERQEAKMEAMAKLFATFDRNGQVDYSEALQIGMEIIDPNWAERVIRPVDVGSAKVVSETQDVVTKAAVGFDVDLPLGTPPQLAMQVIQQYAAAPDVQQRMATDEALRKRIEKLAKQAQFQDTQMQNAKIGRYGA